MERIELAHGESVEVTEDLVVLRMQPGRAHDLAHKIDGHAAWALDMAAASLGHEPAMACGVRMAGTVPLERRQTAAELLPELPLTARVAVVDSAARWLAEEAGPAMAYALLAACAPETSASRAYLALLTP